LTKSLLGHVMPNLYFCILWDLGVTYYILVRPGRETLTHYSSCLGGSGTESTEKRVRACYAEMVFLHSVGSTGHVKHSGASGA
jgi:hypothetical protein